MDRKDGSDILEFSVVSIIVDIVAIVATLIKWSQGDLSSLWALLIVCGLITNMMHNSSAVGFLSELEYWREKDKMLSSLERKGVLKRSNSDEGTTYNFTDHDVSVTVPKRDGDKENVQDSESDTEMR